MGRKGKRTKGMEEAHPFTGMSQVNLNAAGVDIGAVEIVVCVAGAEYTNREGIWELHSGSASHRQVAERIRC